MQVTQHNLFKNKFIYLPKNLFIYCRIEKKTAYPVWQSEHAEWWEKNMAALTSQFNNKRQAFANFFL